MAIAIAMIMGCLPKSSLAAPNGKNSSANEDNSLADEKLKSMMKTKQSSEKVSNFNRAIYDLASFELIWETLGLVFKIPTPVKGVLKSLSNYPEEEIEAIHEVEEINALNKKIGELNKKIGELKEINKIHNDELDKLKNKEINEQKNKLVKLRKDIREFVETKKVYTSNEQQQTYKKILASIYEKYDRCKVNLVRNYFQNGYDECEGFRIVGIKVDPLLTGIGDRSGRYLYMLDKNDESYKQIIQPLTTDEHWSALCYDAVKLSKKIAIGVGLCRKYDVESGINLLKGCIIIGLGSDIEDYFRNNKITGASSIFDFTLYDRKKGINNLDELNKLLVK